MPARANAPAPPPGMLVTGHFHKGPRYRTIREHGTRDWLLVYTVSGHGRYGHDQGEFVTQPGDLVLVRPGVPHDYGTVRGARHWESLWAHFLPRPGWLPSLDWPEVAPGILRLPLHGHEAAPRIAQRFRDVIRLNTVPSRQREALALNALEEILLWCDLANPRRETAGLDSRIRRSLDFICERFAEPLNVARIAAQCGLSPSRFAHLFRAQTGGDPAALPRAPAAEPRAAAARIHPGAGGGHRPQRGLREPVLFHAALQAPQRRQPAGLAPAAPAGGPVIFPVTFFPFSRHLLPCPPFPQFSPSSPTSAAGRWWSCGSSC